jgi:hypothetical protein
MNSLILAASLFGQYLVTFDEPMVTTHVVSTPIMTTHVMSVPMMMAAPMVHTHVMTAPIMHTHVMYDPMIHTHTHVMYSYPRSIRIRIR